MYFKSRIVGRGTMESQLSRGFAFALYQISLLLGIVLLPLALVLGRLGVSVPMHKIVRRLESASAGVSSNAN